MTHSMNGTVPRRALWTAALISSAVLAGPVSAQSASIGADIVSRYVWRGLDFGESMSVQPGLTFSLGGGLEFGAWGSYSISASGAGANENDLWVTYSYEASSGASFAVGMTDYYFPGPRALGFRDGDAHTQEVSVAVSGTEAFPVSLYAGMVLDDDKPVYFEASVPFAVGDAEVGLHAGAVSGESAFYATEGFALVNLGITASTELAITDSFAPPVSVSYIVNPSDSDSGNRAFLVFALSLSP
jgi:uncharacterized protein (TIGR02001 family)